LQGPDFFIAQEMFAADHHDVVEGSVTAERTG
jgi:hypothetical protein